MVDDTRWLVTHFPDGTRVDAEVGAHDDVVQQFHDVAHHVLARVLGLRQSPTLWRQAHGDDLADDDLVAYEEAAVLAMSAYCTALRNRRLA